MKWSIAAIALVVVANGVALVSVRREHAGPSTLTTIDVCSGHLVGGGTSDEAPALRLEVARDSSTTPAGLDPAGLRSLGFRDATINAVGRARDSTYRWPKSRPGWVRLRQEADSLEQWAVVEVVPLRGRLQRDSTSIVVRGLVGLRERREEPPADAMAGHQHGAQGPERKPGVLYPAVLEVIPFQLHLTREQFAALRGALGDTTGCAVKGQAVIASGATGGIWVESVR